MGVATGEYGKAKDAVLLLAQSGNVGADGLEQAARAAVEYSDLTGKSIEDAVGIFAEMQNDPVSAVKKLDEQLHFLTATQLEQIKTAQEQGDTEKAASIAQQASAEALEDRNEKVKASLSGLEKAWDAVTRSIAAHIAQEKLVGSGTANAQLSVLDQQIATLKRTQVGGDDLSNQDVANKLKADGSPLYGDFQALLDKRHQITVTQALDEWVAEQGANDRKVQEAGKKASDTLDEYAKRAKGNDAKAKEIAVVKKATADALAARPGDRTAIEAQQKEALAYIEKQYAPKGGSTTSNELSAEAAQLRDDLQKITTDYTTSMAQLDAARKAGTVSTEAYYQQAHDLLWKSESDQATALQAEIARLEARKGTAKEQIQIDQRVKDLKSQLAKVETDTASKDTVLSTQRAAELKKEQDAVESFTHALQQQIRTRQDAINAQVQGLSQGARQSELDGRINQVNRDADERRYGLQRDLDRGQIGKEQYDAELTVLDRFQKTRVQQEKDADEQLYEARQDWSNGAYAFARDYADQAANTAQQTYSLLGDLSNGFSDNLADDLLNGKANWKDWADDAIKQILRVRIQAVESGFLDAIFPAIGSVLSSSENQAALVDSAQVSRGSIDTSITKLHRAGGGPVWGAGTATSDSIDAKLSNGEYVVQAAAVSHYGLPALEAMNAMRAPRFATGGFVSPRVPSGFVPHFADGGAVNVQAGAAAGPVVQVIDQRSTKADAPEVTTSRMPDGRDLVRILLREVASSAATPGGEVNKAIQTGFGVRNVGVRRG